VGVYVKKIAKIITGSREFLLLIFIAAIIIFLNFRSEYFLTFKNFDGLLANSSVAIIIAAGMTVLFISGGFDISTGNHLAFIGILLGILLGNGLSPLLAIIICLIMGIIDGLIIGMLVCKLKIEPFIVTLGAMYIFRGVAFFAGNSSKAKTTLTTPSFSKFTESFLSISQSRLFNVEYINFYMLIIVIVFTLFLAKNAFFRQNYYIGGNESSARLTGIKVDLLKIFNYILVSFMVAVAAILRTSRIGVASATSGGESLGLTIIAGTIIGGASLRGGSGSIIGSMLGIFLMMLINNGITIMGINPVFSQIAVGVILLVSVLIDEVSRRRDIRK
jgi:ribose transport system permease protein